MQHVPPFATVDPADKHLAAFAKKAKSKGKLKLKKLPPKRFDHTGRGGPAATGPISLQLNQQQPSMASILSPRSDRSHGSPSQLSGGRASAFSSHLSTNMHFYQQQKRRSPPKGSQLAQAG